MSVENKTVTALENKVKAIFQQVLDIKPQEIVPGAKLDESLGIDSTELVEISVVLKKTFNVPLADNEIKKAHSFNDIVAMLKSKGAN